MKRILARRHAASVRKLAAKYNQERLSLTDPLFNIREILKQCVLLEDHLLHPYKLCPDCIHKHLLTIEALGDEGVTLDTPDGKYTKTLEGVSEFARGTMENFHDGEPPAAIAQQVRQLRKMLAPSACDPRSMRDRLASVYVARQEGHFH